MKKCCVIGCGEGGKLHLSHLIGSTDILELTAFCDLIEGRAAALAKASELSTGNAARVYTNYLEILDAETPDMVFLSLPPYCHGDIELQLIERGIPFFVDPPIALDLDTAKKIASAVEEKQLMTAVGFDDRYSNIVKAAADFCRENDVVTVNAVQIGALSDTFWKKDSELSGGLLVCEAMHILDILRVTVGEPAAVCTFGTRGFVRGVTDYNTDDATTTVIRFKNGTIGTLTLGCYAKTDEAAVSKIVFSAADKRAELRLGRELMLYGLREEEKLGKKKEKAKTSVGNIAEMPESADGGFVYRQSDDSGVLCDRQFAEAVASGDAGKIQTPYKDAVKSLEFAMACVDSRE